MLRPRAAAWCWAKWVRQSYKTRGKSALAEGTLGKDTCSKDVIHQVDDFLPRDLCDSLFLRALLNEGVSDVSDVVLRGREDESWQQKQPRNGCS